MSISRRVLRGFLVIVLTVSVHVHQTECNTIVRPSLAHRLLQSVANIGKRTFDLFFKPVMATDHRIANSLGRARNPLGRARNPLGRARNPLGRARNPLGRARNPLGRARNPLGRTRNSLERTRNPLGRTRNSLERMRNPLGRTRNSLGRTRNDIGRGRGNYQTSRNRRPAKRPVANDRFFGTMERWRRTANSTTPPPSSMTPSPSSTTPPPSSTDGIQNGDEYERILSAVA